MTVSTKAKQSNSPEINYDELAHNFIEESLGLTLTEFCTKYEAFCITKSKTVKKNANMRRVQKKTELRNLVRNSLRK